MSVRLLGSTSGQVTLDVPAVAGANTITLPAATGNALTDVTCGVCRAWVNFDGTGTVSIRASYNVTSITDNGTGDYTVNFTNAISDANYTVVASNANRYASNNPSYVCPATAFSSPNVVESAPTTTSIRLVSGYGANIIVVDTKYMFVAIFR